MKALENALLELGLNRYEARAYIALLELNSAKAAEVAERSGVPLAKIYEVLGGLERKGLVESSAGKPKVYRALDPSVALRGYVREKERYLRERLKVALKAACETYSRRVEGEKGLVWTYRDFRQLVQALREALSEARYEVLVGARPALVEAVRGELEGAVRRGVSVLLVSYVDKPRFPTPFIDEVRVRRTDAITVFIVDDEFGIVASKLAKVRAPEYVEGFKYSGEIMLEVLDNYFLHSIYRSSSRIYRELPRSPRTYVNFWRAVDVVQGLRASGYRVRVRVEGLEVGTGKEVVVEGEVERVTAEYREGMFSLLVRAEGGHYLVGGRGAYLEDVEARRVHLLIG